MKIHPAQQNSLEWLQARAGVLTASEFGELVDTKFQKRTGEMPKTLMAKKLAERWTGGPIAGHQTIDMEIGSLLEDEALPFFSLQTGLEVQRVGLVTSDDGRIGCSPDGLLSELSGIEVKCPRAETHIKYLMAGKVPNEYLAQVHGAMYVTGRTTWTFMSYARRFPALILTVEYDEEIQLDLNDAIKDFLAELDAAYERLCEINGGPPRLRKLAHARNGDGFVSDPNDLIP